MEDVTPDEKFSVNLMRAIVAAALDVATKARAQARQPEILSA